MVRAESPYMTPEYSRRDVLYGTGAGAIDRPVGDARTIVIRTFSKIYGLAGLRIGYGVAPLELALRLSAFHLQFGENTGGKPSYFEKSFIHGCKFLPALSTTRIPLGE